MNVHIDQHDSSPAPHYVSADGKHHAPSIAALLQQAPQLWRGWDAAGIGEYLQRAPSGRRSCVTGIQPLPPHYGHYMHHRQPAPQESPTATQWHDCLATATSGILTQARNSGKRVALALSGGLDSALVHALMQQAMEHDFAVYSVVTGLPGYCEREQIMQHAQMLGIRNLILVELTAQALSDALPLAICHAEVPLYNLHPVTRLLLAQRMHRDGIGMMLTGDGADQLFCGTDGRNYLPIVGALARSQGVQVRSPFLESAPWALASPMQPDPGKQALRAVAAPLLGHALANCAKTPRLAPEIDIHCHWKNDTTTALAQQLNQRVCHDSASSRTLWTTLGLLNEHIAQFLTCAV
jgi:asparagine synthase (glutamine-hydrolysing)